MRVSAFLLPLLFVPSLAAAQGEGVALNMGRGLDNGTSLSWTFKENWTLRPTLGLGYSQYTGFEAFVGSTVLRSFAIGDRLYAYAGAGIHFGSVNTSTTLTTSTVPGGTQTPGGREAGGLNDPLTQSGVGLLYFTAPVGLRARIHGNFEAFAETAYQRAMTGQFALSQTGQFSGNERQRLGATFGISLRLN